MKSFIVGFNKLELVLIAIIIVIVYILGAMTDIMDVDAGQYAAMSRQMLETGDWLQVRDRTVEYLDKPPFLFWISALSIKLFGVYSWSYKLPSILLSILGVYSTYSLAALLYNQRTGIIAALMISSCQAIILMNQDVRTDNILSSAIIFSLWQLYAFIEKNRMIHLILGFVGIGIAMLTKGPIGLMMPVFALSSHFIFTKQWKFFFRWEWLPGLVIVALMLVPMCIGLYQQHGTHGLYFYFWEQSFGRITGENQWRNDTTVLYFTHTLLWAFLPWSFLFVIAFYKRTIVLMKSSKSDGFVEALSWGGFLLTFIAFSLSKYKLPHYIFITFPLASIICASWIDNLLENNKVTILNILTRLQLIIAGLLFIVAALLLVVFPPEHIILWILMMGLFIWVCVSSFLSVDKLRGIIFTSIYPILFANVIMNGNFYPQLYKYQAASVAGKLFHEKHQAGEGLYHLNIAGRSLDYYGQIVSKPFTDEVKNNAWIFTDPSGLADLKTKNIDMKEIFELDKYSVQFLALPFLNPATRKSRLEKNYLIHLSNQ
jgi:4-amino-4-deoxy-L-arabinose transferase-like glycosyltransferase